MGERGRSKKGVLSGSNKAVLFPEKFAPELCFSSRIQRELADGVKSGYPLTMLDWSSCPAVERDPDRVSGAWVFRGTRVPVKALFENLESGARIDDFVSWFPGVSREMAEAVLEHAQRSLQTEAH